MDILRSRECKKRALYALRGNWKQAVLACFLASIISGAAFFLVGTMSVGVAIFFFQLLRRGKTDINYAFRGFRAFGSTVLLGLLLLGCFLIISFTSLFLQTSLIRFGHQKLSLVVYFACLIIYNMLDCSFIASYSIKMIFPKFSAIQCMKKSMQIMNGYKWKYFLLKLSFIGWFFLIIIVMPLTFFVGSIVGLLFIFPYFQATKMVFIANVFKNAGYIGDEDFTNSPIKPIVFVDK